MTNFILKSCDPSKKLTVEKGTFLLREGTQSGFLYVLAEGSVDVLRGNVIVASISEPGAVFGEMSMFLATAHTASVQTTSKCVVYAYEEGAAYLRSHPEITYEIAALLAQRLNKATGYIVDLNDTVRSAGNIWAW